MIDLSNIFLNILKQIYPFLALVLALKFFIYIYQNSIKNKKRKEWTSPGFPDSFKIDPLEVPLGIDSSQAVENSTAKKSIPQILPYAKRKPLTVTEAIFYQRLVQALPEYIVLPQVQLSRFITLKNSYWFKRAGKSYALQNRISQQSVDYLICLKDFEILAAIELDDKSHQEQSAIKRDRKKEISLFSAGIPLLRWKVESMPSQKELFETINNLKTYQNEKQKGEVNG